MPLESCLAVSQATLGGERSRDLTPGQAQRAALAAAVTNAPAQLFGVVRKQLLLTLLEDRNCRLSAVHSEVLLQWRTSAGGAHDGRSGEQPALLRAALAEDDASPYPVLAIIHPRHAPSVDGASPLPPPRAKACAAEPLATHQGSATSLGGSVLSTHSVGSARSDSGATTTEAGAQPPPLPPRHALPPGPEAWCECIVEADVHALATVLQLAGLPLDVAGLPGPAAQVPALSSASAIGSLEAHGSGGSRYTSVGPTGSLPSFLFEYESPAEAPPEQGVPLAPRPVAAPFSNRLLNSAAAEYHPRQPTSTDAAPPFPHTPVVASDSAAAWLPQAGAPHGPHPSGGASAAADPAPTVHTRAMPPAGPFSPQTPAGADALGGDGLALPHAWGQASSLSSPAGLDALGGGSASLHALGHPQLATGGGHAGAVPLHTPADRRAAITGLPTLSAPLPHQSSSGGGSAAAAAGPPPGLGCSSGGGAADGSGGGMGYGGGIAPLTAAPYYERHGGHMAGGGGFGNGAHAAQQQQQQQQHAAFKHASTSALPTLGHGGAHAFSSGGGSGCYSAQGPPGVSATGLLRTAMTSSGASTGPHASTALTGAAEPRQSQGLWQASLSSSVGHSGALSLLDAQASGSSLGGGGGAAGGPFGGGGGQATGRTAFGTSPLSFGGTPTGNSSWFGLSPLLQCSSQMSGGSLANFSHQVFSPAASAHHGGGDGAAVLRGFSGGVPGAWSGLAPHTPTYEPYQHQHRQQQHHQHHRQHHQHGAHGAGELSLCLAASMPLPSLERLSSSMSQASSAARAYGAVLGTPGGNGGGGSSGENDVALAASPPGSRAPPPYGSRPQQGFDNAPPGHEHVPRRGSPLGSTTLRLYGADAYTAPLSPSSGTSHDPGSASVRAPAPPAPSDDSAALGGAHLLQQNTAGLEGLLAPLAGGSTTSEANGGPHHGGGHGNSHGSPAAHTSDSPGGSGEGAAACVGKGSGSGMDLEAALEAIISYEASAMASSGDACGAGGGCGTAGGRSPSAAVMAAHSMLKQHAAKAVHAAAAEQHQQQQHQGGAGALSMNFAAVARQPAEPPGPQALDEGFGGGMSVPLGLVGSAPSASASFDAFTRRPAGTHATAAAATTTGPDPRSAGLQPPSDPASGSLFGGLDGVDGTAAAAAVGQLAELMHSQLQVGSGAAGVSRSLPGNVGGFSLAATRWAAVLSRQSSAAVAAGAGKPPSPTASQLGGLGSPTLAGGSGLHFATDGGLAAGLPAGPAMVAAAARSMAAAALQQQQQQQQQVAAAAAGLLNNRALAALSSLLQQAGGAGGAGGAPRLWAQLTPRVRADVQQLLASTPGIKPEALDDALLAQLVASQGQWRPKALDEDPMSLLRAMSLPELPAGLQQLSAGAGYSAPHGGEGVPGPFSPPALSGRTTSLPTSGRSMLQRLPPRVLSRLEELVSRCSYMDWKHLDAGVIKVLGQLSELSEADVLEELQLLEATDLSNVEYMPAYLNKRLNNRLWSRRKSQQHAVQH